MGAKGDLNRRADDAGGFAVEGLGRGRPMEKRNLVRRFAMENAYGRLAAARIASLDPDAALCANTPLDALRWIQAACRRGRVGLVNWLQDINSLAAAAILPGRIPLLGELAGRRYFSLERALLRRSDHIVAISDDFRAHLERCGVLPGAWTVIHNWAPLDELPARPRRNPWAERHRLNGGRNVVYTGNLGLKHNPALLVDLALALPDPGDRLVVVSEGVGADWIARRKRELGLDNLLLLPFQPYSDLPDVMASADLLLALLEPQRHPYCVPSKVLSYCCAGRAIVLSADPGNLASRIVAGRGCGRVVAAGDGAGVVEAVLDLLGDGEARAVCGRNARRYAESTFDIEAIAPRFEEVLGRVNARAARARSGQSAGAGPRA